MKPVSLASSPRDVGRMDASRFEKDRVLQRALDEVYFAVELWPGSVVYEAGGADAVNGCGVMRLPATAAGVVPLVHRNARLRALWPITRPRLTFWYTSPGASTNTFDLRFQLLHRFEGGLTTSLSTFLSVALAPPGPAIANTIIRSSVVGAPVTPALEAPVQVRIARIGGDANANALDILLAVVVFEEVA